MTENFEQFGKFLIFRAIGRGGMGEVYIARTPWDDSPLAAIKRLRPDVARVPNFAERFRREAGLAVRLFHSNIVATLDVGSVHEQLYVASELISGKDTGFIGDRLRERGQGAPLAVVIRVLLDTLSGLSYVHTAREPDGEKMGLVHRDITPGNVLVGYDGVSRLADFGLAKSELDTRSALTQHGEILGTPHYLAPELIRGEPASSASDIYGLGAVMYRVLTGVAPYQGTAAEVLAKALKSKPKPLADLRPDLPPWFITTINSMLSPDLIARPSDAGSLMRRVEHAASRYKLLLPHASVGRWLSALFEEEKEDEVKEFDAIVNLDVSQALGRAEGTKVLATARSETRLEGNSSPFGEQTGYEEEDADLDEETLLAKPAEALNLFAQHSEKAELLGLEHAQKSPKETVKTKLITHNDAENSNLIPSDLFSLPAHDMEEESEPSLSSISGELPGFVDSSAERSIEARQITSPQQNTYEHEANEVGGNDPFVARPRNNPVSSPKESMGSENQISKPSSQPSASDNRRQPTKQPASKRIAPDLRNSSSRVVLSKTNVYWTTLAFGLLLAVFIGTTVALLSTRKSSDGDTTGILEPKVAEQRLKLRYREVRTSMSQLESEGIKMTPEINREAAHAADLLILENLEAASAKLDLIEALLEQERNKN
ncbi:MAG: serine/threonine-protein kinase [Myxococcota bacterium]|nr:serine/threonine-protein kinase [Myxococcota bacterium]